MSNERQALARELLRRQRARARLAEFALAIDIPGVPVGDPEADEAEDTVFGPGTGRLVNRIETRPMILKPLDVRMTVHLVLMYDHIQRIMETPRGRGMIMAPPGTVKSTSAAVVGASWAMGKWPGFQLIETSYASSIIAKHSRRVRQIARDPLYTALWPDRPRLLDDQRAIDDWSMSNGSGMMAAGILAGITGNRADGFIIDDPLANREQADSATIREKIYQEYTDTVLTRAKPKMWVILIMTRWHEDDLAGSILPETWEGESGRIHCRDGQYWDVLSLQAECEREDDPLGRKVGEFIWPEWFPREHWSSWRDNPRAARTWAALFQQRPAPQAGIQFKREMFRWYDPDLPRDAEGGLPAKLNYYGASDFATLDSDKADFTSHGVAGMDSKDNLYFTDWWTGQKETDVGIDRWLDLVALRKPMRWWDEGGVIDKAIGPAKRKRMRERRTYVSLESLPSIMDKSVKLQSFHARCSAGTVWFPLKRPWAERVVDQLIKFPAGKHDDDADVCGLIGRGIDQMNPASLPREEHRDILTPFTERWLEWNETHAAPKVRYF